MSKNASINVGENIKALRKAKKMTQDELADAIGKSRRTIVGYENGKIDVSLTVMMDIAEVLDCCISELFNTETKIPDDDFLSFDNAVLTKLFCNTESSIRDSYNIKVSSDGLDLLNCYEELNLEGRVEARKRIKEMTLLEQYTKPDYDPEIKSKISVVKTPNDIK